MPPRHLPRLADLRLRLRHHGDSVIFAISYAIISPLTMLILIVDIDFCFIIGFLGFLRLLFI